MADIPGLIEGAAHGRGLGHDFLRHVEYAKVLCVLLDRSPNAVLSPHQQLAVLLGELGEYRADLLERPRVLVGSKSDVASDELNVPDAVSISAATGDGVAGLVDRLAELVSAARRQAAAESSHDVVVHAPVVDDLRVVGDGPHAWTVLGRAATRAVRFQDLTDDEALAEIVKRLRAIGVDRLLVRAGVVDGDVVRVGPLSFEWWRDAVGAGLDRGSHHRATRRERLARHGRLDDDDDS